MNAADLAHTPAIAPCAAEPPRKRRRMVLICAALAVAAATALTFTLLHLRSAPTDAVVAAEQARVEARRSLAAFLHASTVEQRAGWVIGGDQVLPLMQAYYAGRELVPLSADDFQPASWSFNTDAPDLIALELPRGRALPTVVACMRKGESGRWLMDWDVWTQSLDGGFREFVTRPAEGEHTLRVRLTSAAASPDEVKLEVADPFNTGSTMMLDTTRADLTALYCADLPTGATKTATVQFVWLNDPLTGTLQPVLRRHICWGFQELDGVEAAEREPARARKHHPPMPAPTGKADLAVTAPIVEAAVETTLLNVSSSTTTRKKETKPAPGPKTTRR